MKDQLFGKSGLRVSQMALGTMTFGEDWGWGASEEESRKVYEFYAKDHVRSVRYGAMRDRLAA